jgi:hypothetical protein
MKFRVASAGLRLELWRSGPTWEDGNAEQRAEWRLDLSQLHQQPRPWEGEAQKALQLIFGEGDLSFVFYPRQAAVPTGGS